MFIKVRRRKHGDRLYEYLDIVENHKVEGKVVRHVLGSLGRRDLLSPSKVDGLIEHLRKLASPEGRRGIRLGDMRLRKVREYGPVLVARRLWEELGLDHIVAALAPAQSVDVEEAVFRMVANRLCAPQSKLGLVDWSDEHGTLHRGWQGEVEWPSGKGEIEYHHYLGAMDLLHPHRQKIEDQVFARVSELFSLPLNLVLFDLTSTYFEGDGVCELAGFGYSRDHRNDRRQVVLGLAVTQEGLPIMQRVFPGNTNDVTTLAPIAKELRQRFGLPEAVLVGDKGMFSDANLDELDKIDFRYVLALRDRSDQEGDQAIKLALKSGLPVPKAPRLLAPPKSQVRADYKLVEVELIAGARHLVVYSPFKALHDFEVRWRRLERSLAALAKLRGQAAGRKKKKLSDKQIVERATRILVANKSAGYFTFGAEKGSFSFRLKRDEYRQQRRHDGLFVLRTNHPSLSAQEVLDAYLQLQEVERCFRVIKSVLELRPVYHHRQRRVETHIFLNFLAFLLAKTMEQKLRAADIQGSIAWALEQLDRLKAVEHTWEDESIVVQTSELDAENKAILDALRIRLTNPVLKVSRVTAA
jgi:transposase